jgi:hypothetical protein
MAQKQYCLGKTPAIFDSRTLRFGTYLTRGLRAPPDTVNWGKNVKSWPMYRNNELGDCTCAAAAHMVQNWSAAAGREKKPTTNQVMKFYGHFGKPGRHTHYPMLTVLKYWRSTGLANDKIRAFAQLEPHNVTEVKDAVSIFGGCYIGIILPKFVTAALEHGKLPPWVVPPHGPHRDAAPDPKGHHCISAVAYDSRKLYVVTWGQVKPMSWQFYRAYCDEAYAILSDDFLSKKKTPNGFDMAQLKKDLAAIGTVQATRAMISHGR